MALTKAFRLAASSSGSETNYTTGTFDSTGYTYIVVGYKYEGGGASTPAFTDNKGSGTFTNLAEVNHSNGDLNGIQAWKAIGTPGTGHTVTITHGAARSWKDICIWVVNATAAIVVDDDAQAQGTGSAPDAGSLVTTAATVSFQFSGGYTSQTGSPGTGWTEDYDSNNNYGQSRADASGTLDPAHSFTGSDAWVTVAASFKEDGGGGDPGFAIPRNISLLAAVNRAANF